MTKEVNVRHVFTQTKKEGGGPPFFVLVTDERGYRTKRVGFIGDGASKLLAPSLF